MKIAQTRKQRTTDLANQLTALNPKQQNASQMFNIIDLKNYRD